LQRLRQCRRAASFNTFLPGVVDLASIGVAVNVRGWSAWVALTLAACSSPVHAQDALVLDTYTCTEFLSDLGDRTSNAKLRRSLMMIAWAAGYAAARHKDASSSLEVIAATLGDVCRISPTAKAAKAITDKLNESSDREGSSRVTGSTSVATALAAPSAPGAPAAPPAATGERPFTVYSSRDMQGGDYHKQRGVSQEGCESLCRRDPRCQAYSYDIWNRYCFLKASVQPLRLEPRSVTAVTAGLNVTYDDGEPLIQRRPQKAFPNEPYLQANAQSYGDCAVRCLKDKRCEAFNFYQSARRCNLIEKPNEYSDDRGTEIGIKVQAAR
jgi:hypothetical protein